MAPQENRGCIRTVFEAGTSRRLRSSRAPFRMYHASGTKTVTRKRKAQIPRISAGRDIARMVARLPAGLYSQSATLDPVGWAASSSSVDCSFHVKSNRRWRRSYVMRAFSGGESAPSG